MNSFNIIPLEKNKEQDLINKIDQKTKPIGSLGTLEKIALKIGLIQNTLTPNLNKPTIIVFAADHGIAKSGVSPYPQEVTYQMVLNFLHGGAAINVFAKQNNIDLKIVDSGVNFDFKNNTNLINRKIDYGTKNYLYEKAMTEGQVVQAINEGAKIVDDLFKNGVNVIGFGEMGIGNTSSASIITSLICKKKLNETVGPGTGHLTEGLKKKIEILSKALENNLLKSSEPLDILSVYGGFEIAMMVGAFLKAAEHKMVILVDGFIVTSALLIAYLINKNILDYCIFTHISHEPGHKIQLNFLKANPILSLDLRLGEGTGAAICYPIVKSAVSFLNEMASFEDASVSKKL